MAERERHLTPPRRGVFVARAQVMTASDVRRALTRIAHEVIERNRGLGEVALVGLQTGGAPLAVRLAAQDPNPPLADLESGRYSRIGSGRA